MKKYALILLLLLIPACQSAPSDVAGSSDPIADLEKLAVADLTAALADAEAHNDIIAAQCWRGLIPIVERVRERLDAPNIGVVTSFQKARNIRRAVSGGVSDELRLACAPLYMDSRAAILRWLAPVGL